MKPWRRQVIIGGKNKYMINGANIQANRVADFFRSVQLNVNNPHFLIMQGRITKVLNMKPPEVKHFWLVCDRYRIPKFTESDTDTETESKEVILGALFSF